MAGKSKTNTRRKSTAREWLDAIIFAVVVATAIRWLVMEPYQIPTSSMERSLLVGDFLFVSKYHYGSRNAKTILQVPLTHQTIWGTEIPSYLDWIQIPFFRLPGFSEVKRGDAVVFNTPEELNRPVDMRTYLIKRCVGVAGDTISINDGVVFINNEPANLPGKRQHSYFIATKQSLRDRFFEKYQIRDVMRSPSGYQVMTSEAKANEIRTLEFIEEVIPLNDKTDKERFSFNVFPGPEKNAWTFNNFGPLYIPKKGKSITISKETIRLYGNLIKNHEGNKKVLISSNSIKIDGKELSEYTFRQDYFFMMGDNRHNSHDSRAWGFVPMDHIVGKALFTWFSIEEGSFIKLFSRIRYNRIFKSIE